MKTAVISGGNGGLGRAMAQALQASGWHTVLLDRDIDGLKATPQQTPIKVDLTDSAALKAACDHVLAAHPTLDLVIYNAGVSQVAAFSDTADDSHRRVFEINYFAAVAMARALLPAVRAAGGRHLAISSVAGFAPLYHRTAYAASKHALQGFFGSLAAEEVAHGVKTAIAVPSFIGTNLGRDERSTDGIQRPGSASDGVDYMTPDDAARIILRGVARGRRVIPVGRVAWASWLISRLSPALFNRLMRGRIKGQS
ncbi:SDR family NAD(P)-dependent oxidoreductase [Nioella nitratireducens]|uniref:SDR family NAD(P)-dependent oxidoreductase n=1 Tax=Nioella nitratireducens TaxID=1287720 RepID=UPI0008FD69FA|nr:SDR family NAD(P)-dependent oxidoreductase [Nioella nitratireducens]